MAADESQKQKRGDRRHVDQKDTSHVTNGIIFFGSLTSAISALSAASRNSA